MQGYAEEAQKFWIVGMRLQLIFEKRPCLTNPGGFQEFFGGLRYGCAIVIGELGHRPTDKSETP